MPDRFVGALVFWNRAHAATPYNRIKYLRRSRRRITTRVGGQWFFFIRWDFAIVHRGEKSENEKGGSVEETKTKGEGALFGAKGVARQRNARERGGLRRKDTSSLGAKKRNGHSPARWRKVGRSQPLTGAKETLRAIADSCPLGRGASRDRSPFSLPLPLPLLVFLGFFAFLFYSLRSAAPPRDGPVPENYRERSFARKLLDRGVYLRCFFASRRATSLRRNRNEFTKLISDSHKLITDKLFCLQSTQERRLYNVATVNMVLSMYVSFYTYCFLVVYFIGSLQKYQTLFYDSR